MATWTRTPFNLLNGNPFELEEYDVPSLSEETQLRALEKGIRERDGGRCIICGSNILRSCHIVPTIDSDHVRCSLLLLWFWRLTLMVQWETMKDNGFVPHQAKDVQYETRNAVQLCKNHYAIFRGYYFYIRWIPEVVFLFSKRLLFLPAL